MTPAKLKPCPKCGGKGQLSEFAFVEDFAWSVICDVCGMQTRKRRTREEAIEHWNYRPLEQWEPEPKTTGWYYVIGYPGFQWLIVNADVPSNKILVASMGYECALDVFRERNPNILWWKIPSPPLPEERQ